MNRFVILEHLYRGRHWDFMLEWGDALRTWAIEETPAPGAALEARQLADHRLVYLDYEGPVSGDRGEVTRWDHGTYEVIEDGADRLVVTLSGQRLIGRASLCRDTSRARSGESWMFQLAPNA